MEQEREATQKKGSREQIITTQSRWFKLAVYILLVPRLSRGMNRMLWLDKLPLAQSVSLIRPLHDSRELPNPEVRA